MLKVKSQLQRIVDWKGWRWVYYCEMLMLILYAIFHISYAVLFFICHNCLISFADYGSRSATFFLTEIVAFGLIIFLSTAKLESHFYKMLMLFFVVIIYFLTMSYRHVVWVEFLTRNDPKPIFIYMKR